MGIIKKVVIGSIAVGAAKMAMRNKRVSKAAGQLARKVRTAAGLKAVQSVVSRANAGGKGGRAARRRKSVS